MAKPSIENIKVWEKVANGAGFDWDVSFTLISSTGKREEGHRFFGPAILKPELWDQLRAHALAFEAAITTPVVEPVKEFEGRYDATRGTMRLLDEADYPAT